ncbi:hypothetical protein [Akkermansia muciniphila]
MGNEVADNMYQQPDLD